MTPSSQGMEPPGNSGRFSRAIQPSSREKTAHDLRVGELQWPPEDGENVTNRTVNAPLKTGQNVLDVTGELNRPRQSHAQVHGGSHEGSSRPQRRSLYGPAGR